MVAALDSGASADTATPPTEASETAVGVLTVAPIAAYPFVQRHFIKEC
ncbi:hypothetical protein [Streptosporangium sp. NPDC000509]